MRSASGVSRFHLPRLAIAVLAALVALLSLAPPAAAVAAVAVPARHPARLALAQASLIAGAPAEITAGDTYDHTISVTCDTGPTTGNLSVQVSPSLPASLNPTQVTTDAQSDLTIPTQNTTPSATYSVTVSFAPTSGACTANSLVFSLIVDTPVRLKVTPKNQTLGLGDQVEYTVAIQKKNYSGPVTLQASGLPSGVTAVFDPTTTTGTSAKLTLSATENAAQVTNQPFLVNGSARVQVTAGMASLTVAPEVRLTATPASQAVNGSGTVHYTVAIDRRGYFSPTNPGGVAITEQFLGGSTFGLTFTQTPGGFTSGPRVDLAVQVGKITKAGAYTLVITPFFPVGVNVKPVSTQVQLVVNQPQGVVVQAMPAAVATAAGQTVPFSLTYTKTGVSGPVTFQQVLDLPAGAKFMPQAGTVEPQQIEVTLDPTTPSGTYSLTFRFTYMLGGVSTTVDANPVQLTIGTLAIMTNTNLQNLRPGGKPGVLSVGYLVNVIRGNGFAGDVQLSLLPPPPPPNCSPPPAEFGVAFDVAGGLVPADDDSASFTVTAPLDEPPSGPYCVAIGAAAADDPALMAMPTYVMFQVPGAPAPPTLVGTPASQTVPAGQTAVYVLTLGGGSSQAPATLSAGGLPAGATATFSPQPATSQATLSVALPAATTPGSYTLTIGGTAGGATLQPISLGLTVSGPPPPPAISGFSPASGTVGTTVTIDGTNFAGVGVTGVSFHGTPATSFNAQSATVVTAVVPYGITSGPITVTTLGGSATSAASFNFIPPPPAISGFSPASGPVGTLITINGANFQGVGVTGVSFGGKPATSFNTSSPTVLTATVPTGAASGPITVTTLGGQATSAASFSVTASAPAGGAQ